ncbi:molybdopterin-dependent oxidoreductase [Oceanicoccus sp. KOV_DT_Chl]|uniref:molybdopterin-containing oxidoreductase family protein n=1 Tax=Oceanicoccus sp. KOV_DT_Chl TaxID=1904639 RepID=UPI000C7D97A3|nr:molybdopterin-dependent oxidoreductase [Oceanicoccus sp. KOV_DT_Chl]
MNNNKTVKTFCKICSAYCGIEVDVADEKILAIRGDQSHPMSKGYTCVKGRQWASQYHNDNRLLSAHSRASRDQDFSPLGNEQALDEIADKLNNIIDKHGPRAVAIYRGNGLSVSSNGNQVAQAWLAGIGSEMDFSSMTLDQPSKIIAVSRHGVWGGGAHGFAGADVCMLIGNNPIISALNMTGAPPGWNPTALKEEKKRGLKLIVIDPRRTETAEHADIYLPVRPGEDAALLAGMVRIIIEEELYDKEFVDAETEGFTGLKAAVESYTLDYVAARCDLPADDIAAAARLFANCKRGTASSGTGPDMASFPHLSEHLILALNTLCGRWNRQGDPVSAPNLLLPNIAPPAQTLPAEFLPAMLNPAMDTKTSRIRGIKQVFQEMPTPVAAEEILLPGEGQVKALIVIGGNPVMSWPDQQKTLQALAALDLLVCIDIGHTATTKHADYLLPAAHAFERDGLAEFTDRLYDKPFGQYSKPVLKPQGNVQEEWRYLAGLAKRLGTKIELAGGPIDVDNAQLETIDILELMFPNDLVKVTIRELAKHEGGKLYEEFANIKVAAPYEGMDAKLKLLPAEVAQDLIDLYATPTYAEGQYGSDGSYTHLLTVRRVKHVYNSSCHDFPKNPPGNPAYLHPDDISALGLSSGQMVKLQSETADIKVLLEADSSLRRGIVSMSHCFGGDPTGVEDIAQFGASASKLVAVDKDFDPLMGMPKMTGFPVKLAAL